MTDRDTLLDADHAVRAEAKTAALPDPDDDGGAAMGLLAQTQIARAGGGAAHAGAARGLEGAAVDFPHRERIEAAYGQPLAAQAFVDEDARRACAEMGAQAFTLGDRVAFGSQPDVHTAAHEAAHVLQQRRGCSVDGGVGRDGDDHEVAADRAADLVVQGRSAQHLFAGGAAGPHDEAIQMKSAFSQRGREHGLPEDMFTIYHPTLVRVPAPPDGVSEKLELGPVPHVPPGTPSTHEKVPLHPLHPEDFPQDTRPSPFPSVGPQQPAPKPEHVFLDPAIEGYRNSVWAKFTHQNDILFGFLNGSAPRIKDFHNAAKDPRLAELYGLVPGKGDVEAVANAQVVPKGSHGMTVGDVFKDGKGKAGAHANTAGLDDKLAHAKENDKVIADMMKLKSAESGVDKALADVSAASSSLSAAGHHLASANFAVAMEKAESKKENAEAKKAALEAQAAKIKGLVGKVIGVAAKLATFVVNPAAGAVAVAAEAGSAASSGGGGVDKIAGGASFIADKVVDLIYGSKIEATQHEITAAVREYRQARAGKAEEDWLEAVDKQSEAVQRLLSATIALKQALVARRLAYFELAGAAGAAGGGTHDQQQRVSALVASVPVCETVVTLTDSILDHWRGSHMEPWSEDLGVGMGMAIYHNPELVERWETFVGYSMDYYESFTEKNALWKERLASLRAVMNKMGADSA